MSKKVYSVILRNSNVEYLIYSSCDKDTAIRLAKEEALSCYDEWKNSDYSCDVIEWDHALKSDIQGVNIPDDAKEIFSIYEADLEK